MRAILAALLTSTMVCAGLTCRPLAAPQNGTKTVWSGVYTSAQAARGKAEYDRACSRCHASNLDGSVDASLLGDFAPRYSLRGADFMERWREDTVQSLYALIASGMPPRNESGGAAVALNESA